MDIYWQLQYGPYYMVGRAMEEERGRNGLVGALGLPALLLVRFLIRFVFCILYFVFCILKVMEEELAALAELRMKEESATELSVRLLNSFF